MADAVAGAILFELKGQATELNKTFERAKQLVTGFGRDVVQTSNQVTQASTKMSAALSQMAATSARIKGSKTFFVEGDQSLPASLNAIAQANKKAAMASGEMDAAFVRNLITAKDLARQANATGAAVRTMATEQGKVAASFGVADRASIKMAERFSRISVAMLTANNVMGDVTASAGKMSTALEAGAKGAQSFLFMLAAMPTPVGAALAAVAALATMYGVLSNALKEVNEQMERVDANTKKAQGRVFAAGGKADAAAMLGGAQGDVQRAIDEMTDSLEKQTTAIRANEDALAQDFKTLETLNAERQRTVEAQRKAATTKEQIGVDDLGRPIYADQEAEVQRLMQKLESLDLSEGNVRNSIEVTTLKLKEQRAAVLESIQPIKNLKEAMDLLSAQGAFNAARDQIGKSAEIQQKRAALGIAMPGEASGAALQTSQAALQAALEMNQAVRAAADKAGSDEVLRQKILSTLIPDSYIQAYADAVKAATQKVKDERIVDEMAGNFGSAVTSGLRQAILSGAKPMEALAGIANNLFENALNDAMKAAQEGLSSIFKAVAGEGGAGIAGALTGALGIAGAIFAKRKGGVDQSFASIQSRIESSQAVRGIVAGPSSVAISEVGEKIERAFEPSRQVFLQMLNELKSINRKTGGGGGSLSFAGTVPTV